ncbi:MAG: YkgJ family cysteine cluster protein [Epsilonproteobacteria bacterium]|nr:MAG: YkgJ family cysteine cluster protein [Campylobacterota bacterium]
MFPCTSCGLCCKNISQIKELKEFDLENGICKYLDLIDNSCKIYESRPDICRIEKMFDIKYNKYFTKNKYYIENAKVCNELQEKYKLDNSFRVNIGE